MNSVSAGQEFHALGDANDFYLLGLSGNSARAIIRDYLEAPLPQVQANLGRWFRDLTIAAATKKAPANRRLYFPCGNSLSLRLLKWIRSLRKYRPPCTRCPERRSRSRLCAFRLPRPASRGGQRRLPAGPHGFDQTHSAKEEHPCDRDPEFRRKAHPAYVCGRLLSVFEQIQYAALGDVNATVTDKFFGTFSAAPAVVIGRLFANAQNHCASFAPKNLEATLPLTNF